MTQRDEKCAFPDIRIAATPWQMAVFRQVWRLPARSIISKEIPGRCFANHLNPIAVYQTQEALYIADWSADRNFPSLHQLLKNKGIKVGSSICLPLTTAHRRLGALSICVQAPHAYYQEDIGFLHLIARGVALAIDDALNLKKSRATQSELEQQNARLKLLLDLTNRINSNLDLR